MHCRTRSSLLTLLIAGAAATPLAAHAAELGDARVASHIGQQLIADIELTMLDDAATPVRVRLADPEVYSGAGVALPPVLSGLSLSVMRREGRQFLHATTLRPVDADHLHLYLELSEHGQRAVRLVTLWLTPDPNPAPLPAVAPAPAPVPVHLPVPAPALPVAAPVAAPTIREPAPRAAHPAPVVRTPAHAPTRAASEPAAPPPSAPARASIVPALPLHAGPPPKIAALAPHGTSQPPACAQGGEAQACTGLGARNAELQARIGQLEDRVKGLQARLGAAAPAGAPTPSHAVAKPEVKETKLDTAKHEAAKSEAHLGEPHASVAKPAPCAPTPEAAHADAPAPAPAQEAKPPPPPPGPKPISSIKPLVPHKPKAAPPDDELPWGMVGAGLALLAAIGGAAALLKLRAKTRRNVDIPAAPGKLATLRQRFFARNEGGVGADPLVEPDVEPTLD